MLPPLTPGSVGSRPRAPAGSGVLAEGAAESAGVGRGTRVPPRPQPLTSQGVGRARAQWRAYVGRRHYAAYGPETRRGKTTGSNTSRALSHSTLPSRLVKDGSQDLGPVLNIPLQGQRPRLDLDSGATGAGGKGAQILRSESLKETPPSTSPMRTLHPGQKVTSLS